jgi:chemotaxis signal transduction protein
MSDGRPDHLILFSVAGTTYALPSRDVAHIDMVEHVTRVPNAAPFIDGVVFSRGQIVPVINLRARFGFERVAADLRTRFLVANAGDRTVGLLVDACREFLTIDPSTIHPPSDALAGGASHYIGGIATIGERMIVILNLEQLLASAEPILAA